MDGKPAFRGTSTTEDVTAFRDVPIADLPSVAEDLRHVALPRTGWGRWRAIAHDFVYGMLGTVAAWRSIRKNGGIDMIRRFHTPYIQRCFKRVNS